MSSCVAAQCNAMPQQAFDFLRIGIGVLVPDALPRDLAGQFVQIHLLLQTLLVRQGLATPDSDGQDDFQGIRVHATINRPHGWGISRPSSMAVLIQNLMASSAFLMADCRVVPWTMQPLSLAPGFSRVGEQRDGMTSRFNGLPRKRETVETVPNTA
jgi:hypothetical protein